LRWSILLLGVPICPRTFLVRRLAAPKGWVVVGTTVDFVGQLFQTYPSIVCIADDCADTDYLMASSSFVFFQYDPKYRLGLGNVPCVAL